MVTVQDYIPRVVDTELDNLLRHQIAIVIEGAKSVGKTETASHLANSRVLLDVDRQARVAAEIVPALILEGDKPRLIDEWQEVPSIWNHVRRAVDAREGPFILTGSAVPADDATRHTGAGRFLWVRMRPMSLFETGRSSGAASLSKLLDGEPTRLQVDDSTIPEIVDLTCIGGWPALVGTSVGDAQRILRGYLDSVARTDIRRVDGVARDPQKVQNVLRSLARNVSTEASVATVARDAGGPEGALDDDTVRRYLTALDRLSVLEDLPAWAPSLRSRARLRSASKRHFCDPSLAVAALRAGPSDLLRDLNYFGFLFESLVVRDLRVYAQHVGARVFHYRDNIGEVDMVIDDGERWGALEVKLGTTYVEAAAKNLRKFAERIDQDQHGRPAFLGVVVPARYGYTREDGIQVLPLQALGP